MGLLSLDTGVQVGALHMLQIGFLGTTFDLGCGRTVVHPSKPPACTPWSRLLALATAADALQFLPVYPTWCPRRAPRGVRH
jgi:hypothetical protein